MTNLIQQALFILGIALFFGFVILTLVKYLRAPRPKALPVRGWVGLGIILGAEVMLWAEVEPIATFFTATAWTGYLFLVDGMVEALTGSSRMTRDLKGFLALAFWSIPLWLVFEAYNLRLGTWVYLGLPPEPEIQAIGYAWAFATIWPAIFLSADLVRALGWVSETSRKEFKISPKNQIRLAVLGLIMVIVPVLVPASAGTYLFGSVWIGFILLLDPINHWAGQRSFLGQLAVGKTGEFWGYLLGGTICGLLWEFWNYWAGAQWHYIFPIGQDFKIFEMPALGYLGFGPFAIECFVMYEFLRTVRKQFQRRTSETDRGWIKGTPTTEQAS
ncbi:MAG: hypothetical protein O6850_00475 [Acidobacteria bacterium]|nr:hypothetical protein [Acidobacteriota bacterium]